MLYYVKADFTNVFAQKVLPHLTKPFAVLSSNGAYSVPRGQLDKAMLDHPLLIKWFAKNPSFYHPKFMNIPIGLTDRPLALSSMKDFDELIK